MRWETHAVGSATVKISNEMFTGHVHAIMPSVFRSIVAICNRNSGVTDFYIGVASGVDYWSALKSRIDERKLAWGVTHMYLLYGSGTERYTRDMERAIEAHFRGKAQRQNIHTDRIAGFNHPVATLQNATGGGGGRRGSSGNYFLYLALRKALAGQI